MLCLDTKYNNLYLTIYLCIKVCLNQHYVCSCSVCILCLMHAARTFSLSTVTVSAESVDGPTPAARVNWSTTIPPECVASVRVDFRLTSSSMGLVVATNTTTNTSQTEFVQTGLQCTTNYYITVVVTGATSDGITTTASSSPEQVLVGGKGIVFQLVQQFDGGYTITITDTPTPVGVRAVPTVGNTSIRVSWEWQGVPICANNVSVHYQTEGGSLMMYTVNNTTATSATLPNLQCNTEYTVWIHASGDLNNSTSAPEMAFLPARGMNMLQHFSHCVCTVYCTLYHYTTPAPPTPTEVTAQFTSTSTVRVAWGWNSSGQAPSCFNTTTVTYRPEGGGEQLSNATATETTLTGLHNNTCYTITVVATAGEHRTEGTVFLPLQGIV